jgi:hypothetical protein
MTHASAPLFRDPILDGAADPTIIWNPQKATWWLLYTNRRATVDVPGFAWCMALNIGIASVVEQGAAWLYPGTLSGLDDAQGRKSYWALEVLWHDERYHM